MSIREEIHIENDQELTMTDENFKLLQQEYGEKSKRFDEELLKIPLKETGEEFSYLPELSKKYGLEVVIDDKENAYLRKSIAISLMETAEYFNGQGLVLKVESAYRNLEEQEKRFIMRFQSMKKSFPEKSKTELLKMANTYTAGIPILAAHIAGAAVDVTLLDQKGAALDFGVPYRHGDIESITDYPRLSSDAKQNRKILKNGMESYGFINYPFEYWHFSMGDVCAAHLTGQKYAKFGPVNYNPESNKTSFPKITNAFYTFFNTP